MLSLENVTYAYDTGEEAVLSVPVLEHVSLEVPRGQFVAVLGHNGSGKSTLAKHLNALLLPSGGTVTVFGLDTKDEERLWDIRRSVGMVFQNPDNQMVATIVEEDVAFGPENLGVPHEEIRERVDFSLKKVGMYEHRKAAPHQLSGGQKQRVAIAGVIAMRPRCIVLDEPTAMLDPVGRREVMETIRKLNQEDGITVVHITHYMDEAVEADRVVVMDEGEILLDGTPGEVFSKVEEIKAMGLDVPQPTELSYLLRKAGCEMPDDILGVAACVDAVAKLFEA